MILPAINPQSFSHIFHGGTTWATTRTSSSSGSTLPTWTIPPYRTRGRLLTTESEIIRTVLVILVAHLL